MIELNHIRPEPIFSKPKPPLESEIWNKKLQFKQGERYWVQAPSGGGKSTLLHIIFGLRKDYEGQVIVAGTNPKSAAVADVVDLRKKRLSMVFQNLRLVPNLSARQNIELTRRITSYKTEAQSVAMCEALGAMEYLDQSTATLSYGQRQRIAIVRALCRPFSFLLLDEPFSHLDADNITAACQLIDAAATEQNAGLILISHERAYSLNINNIRTL